MAAPEGDDALHCAAQEGRTSRSRRWLRWMYAMPPAVAAHTAARVHAARPSEPLDMYDRPRTTRSGAEQLWPPSRYSLVGR